MSGQPPIDEPSGSSSSPDRDQALTVMTLVVRAKGSAQVWILAIE